MTAVEWLEQQLKIELGHLFDDFALHMEIEEAKEMEKQQIEDAYNKSFEDRYLPYHTGERYYKEKYKTTS